MGALATSILTDPRLDSLDAETYRAFARIACFVAQGGELDLAAVEKASKLGPLSTARIVAALADAGLIGEDSEGRLRLGNGAMSHFSASNEGAKSDTARRASVAAVDNVVAMPETEKRRPMTVAERKRRSRARKSAQLRLPLVGGAIPGGKNRRVTAARHNVTKNVTPRDSSAAQSEISQSVQCEENQPVTKPSVTGVTKSENGLYIYNNNYLQKEEDIYTADVTRHAARRDSRRKTIPPPVQAVIDHCLPKRWPPRKGENPKREAIEALTEAWLPDDDPQVVIAAFERWRASAATVDLQNTPHIPQAKTWFGKRRWEDWLPAADPPRKEASPAIRAPPAIDPIDTATVNDLRWLKFSELVSAAIGPEHWQSWFSRLVPREVEHGVLRIAAPTRFVATYVESHYGSHVRSAAGAAYGTERVFITGEPEAMRAAQTKRAAAGARAPP